MAFPHCYRESDLDILHQSWNQPTVNAVAKKLCRKSLSSSVQKAKKPWLPFFGTQKMFFLDDFIERGTIIADVYCEMLKKCDQKQTMRKIVTAAKIKIFVGT